MENIFHASLSCCLPFCNRFCVVSANFACSSKADSSSDTSSASQILYGHNSSDLLGNNSKIPNSALAANKCSDLSTESRTLLQKGIPFKHLYYIV